MQAEENKQTGRSSQRYRAPLILIGCLILATAAWWYNAHGPVRYPAGWPLEYVKVPEGARRCAIRDAHGRNLGKYVLTSDWQTEKHVYGDGTSRYRSWTVGYDYGGTPQQAKAELEKQLEGHGWIGDRCNHANDEYAWVDYSSPEYCYEINLVQRIGTDSGPYGYLTIREYMESRDGSSESL
jgi:hypothetical protein